LTATLLFSCNNDDDITEPVPDPIVANAKVLFPGDCRLEEMFVELYSPDPNIIDPLGMNYNDFQFFNLPEEFRIDDLEVFIEYIEPQDSERTFCTSDGRETWELKMTSIALPTE
jgi:hypothetical protein